MRATLAGLLSGLAIVAIAATFVTTDALAPIRWEGWRSTLPVAFEHIVLIPFASAGATLALLHGFWPRRFLDRRRRGAAAGASTGLLIGGLWLILQTLGLWLAAGTMPESLLSGVAGIASASAVFVCTARCRPGHCVNCGYDIRSASGGSLCPECGALGSRYEPA